MTTEATEKTEVETKPARVRKNGQTRPEAGSKTGLIWDIADRITSETGVVASKDEVWNEYKGKVDGPAEATVATQYGRWVIFNGYQEQVKAQRKAAKDAKAGAEDAAKAAAKQAKEEERKRKADEKAAAKKTREEERAAKAAAKQAEKDAKANANSPAVVGADATEQVSEEEVEQAEVTEEEAGE
jgi:hypothetical protein